MIDRYTSDAIADIWSDKRKYQTWALVEKAVVEGWYSVGVVSEEALDAITRAPAPTEEEVREHEQVTKHDVVAFVRAFSDNVDSLEHSRWIHYGVTSSDIVDTANACLIKWSLKEMLVGTGNLCEGLSRLAKTHKDTLCLGRTHGVHAEPTTFGLKVLGHAAAIKRSWDALMGYARDQVVGSISGAIGTYSTVDPRVERVALDRLNLIPETVPTQVVARDRYAVLMAHMAVLASNIERLAVEIRHLHRPEIGEAMESFGDGQTGSSVMPHKRNPITAEKLCGLARLVRSNVAPAMETIALWHERDISNSSVERIILPDTFALVDHMLSQARKMVQDLYVDKDRMLHNMAEAGSNIYSSWVLKELVADGMSRREAYELVKHNSAEDTLDQFDLPDPMDMISTQDDVFERFNGTLYSRHNLG